MIFQAIEYATRVHSGQYRKATQIPYIIHPLAVARILIEHGCRSEMVSAGILHDTLEDTRATVEEIVQFFGKEVADLVLSVSEPNHSDHTWENRKAFMLKHLRTASRETLVISLADKLDNIRSIVGDYENLGENLWKRFNRPKEKQKWYYDALAVIFADRLIKDDALLASQFKALVSRVFDQPCAAAAGSFPKSP